MCSHTTPRLLNLPPALRLMCFTCVSCVAIPYIYILYIYIVYIYMYVCMYSCVCVLVLVALLGEFLRQAFALRLKHVNTYGLCVILRLGT